MLFLQKVYCYNKLLFSGMLIFMAVQLFCFYKGGMVFSPFYNYGMYSEVMDIKPDYKVNRVGNVKGSDFTPQSWDKIFYTLGQYQALAINESLYKNEVSRLFAKAHLPTPARWNFVQPLSHGDFNTWYHVYIKLHKDSADWQTEVYFWNGETLIPAVIH